MKALKKNILITLFCLQAGLLLAQYKVIITCTSVPPFNEPVYIAGDFNGWNPADVRYQGLVQADKKMLFTFTLPAGNYAFKFTRGSWAKVECAIYGANISDRSLTVQGDVSMACTIAAWKDAFGEYIVKHTTSPQVRILDTAFYMPQLKRNRRVWVYLPKDYATGKRYPVLYMHDGQNLFDAATSFAGEWGVDECMDSLFDKKKKTCIVVGIDNGGQYRGQEYSPYINEKVTVTEGDAYVDFLVKTLKPFIDKKYRTRKGKTDTHIAGSSRGGLISYYALWKYPKVFGGAGIFSPSFWAAPQMEQETLAKGARINSRIYFYAGQSESTTMGPDLLKIFGALQKVSRSKMTVFLSGEGKHNEASWRQAFPAFINWVLQ
jgi:predicted alpha/beta superfamily hydrolase